jgi:tRNA pseudouridine38-40 synthase
MRTFKLTLAYDGTHYAGWQSQVDQPTVQAALEAVLERITGQSIRTIASGRTDAGVHALGQVVGFQTDTHLSDEVLLRAIRAYLPADIALKSLEPVPSEFHAIRNAVSKRYRYLIAEGPTHSLFERQYVWQYPTALDLLSMSQAANTLLGEHDFASFASSGSDRKTTVRTVLDLSVKRQAKSTLHVDQTAEHLIIEVEANGFLYNMVRNIVGTLVEVGRGAQPVSWVAEVLERQDRRAAGPTAPPHGLYLVQVNYPD